MRFWNCPAHLNYITLGEENTHTSVSCVPVHIFTGLQFFNSVFLTQTEKNYPVFIWSWHFYLTSLCKMPVLTCHWYCVRVCVCVLRLYFLKAVIGLQKKERKLQRFPIYPCPHTCIASSIINTTHQSGTFVTIDEATLTHHITQSP